MDIIYTNSSFCGSGKTFDAMTAACHGITQSKKTCIAVPSRRLAKQVLRDACHRFPELKARIACFVSNPRKGETAIGRITKYLLDERDGQGDLLVITHAALQMIAHWRNKGEWHLIVDEELNSECHIPIRLKRPETRAALCDLFLVRPWDDHYSVLEAVDHGKLMDIRDHLYDDQIDELFAPLTMRLLPSSSWSLFVRTAQWQQFVTGENDRFDVHGLLHPQLLDGFASVKVMAANIEDTLMAAYWRKMGRNMLRATPKPVTPIGDRLTIKYLPVPKWSKRLRDLVVCQEDGTTVGEMYAQLCVEEAQKHDPNAGNHLFITNLDNTDVEFGGMALPAIPHGMNDCQHATVCAIFSALNRQPAHEAFLRHMLGITEREIRRATVAQVAYQAACRGIIRKADADGRFLLLLPDQATAEDCAAIPHFQGCRIEPMITPHDLPQVQPKSPGRPSMYTSQEERKAAKREQDRLAQQRKRWRVSEKTLEVDNLSSDMRMESDDVSSLVHRLHIWARDDLDGIATIRPETNGVGGFALSHWQHYRDKDGLGFDAFMPTDLLATKLRQWQGREYAKKKKVPMFSPTIFDADLSEDHNRGKENAALCRGIILDVEHSCIRPDEWPALLPELQMILYSSFGHTDKEPRYRICIPSTHYVSPFVHEMLGRMTEHRLVQMGYGDEASSRPHGLDTGKFERTSLFFRPSHRPEMFLVTHLDGGRSPLNPYEWLDKCPHEVWMDNVHVEVIADDTSRRSDRFPATPIYPNGGGLVQYGLNKWRETGPLPGGHRKFWYLAKCLYDGGLDRATIEAHLPMRTGRDPSVRSRAPAGNERRHDPASPPGDRWCSHVPAATTTSGGN
jgi:hypothetical protein